MQYREMLDGGKCKVIDVSRLLYCDFVGVLYTWHLNIWIMPDTSIPLTIIEEKQIIDTMQGGLKNILAIYSTQQFWDLIEMRQKISQELGKKVKILDEGALVVTAKSTAIHHTSKKVSLWELHSECLIVTSGITFQGLRNLQPVLRRRKKKLL